MELLLEEILKSPDNKETEEFVSTELTKEPSLLYKMGQVVSDCGMRPVDAVSSACEAFVSDSQNLYGDESSYELFTKVLLGKHVEEGLEWFQHIGFVEKYLIELEATKHLKQELGRHHKDVWEHTKLVVKQSIPVDVIRWGALLHDIGKVPTRRFKKNGVTFHGHAEVGARMFDKMCKRMFFPEEQGKTIRFLIYHHLRSAQYEEGWTDNAVRRFYKDLGDELSNVLALSRADITSKRPGRRKALLYKISALAERVEKLKQEDAKVPPLPKGLGTSMMERFNIPPSKKLGDLRKVLESLVENGEIEGHKDDGYYLDVLAERQLV